MSFDLKPLTNETIHKMGYTPHDLWVVKFDNEEVFGPFEVESLKDYATENEKQFQKAYASRMDTNDWQPFFTHAHFQKIEHANSEAPVVEKYWILNLGQKAGPLSRSDIDKKIELDLLSMTDVVSIDDGHTWIKFFNLAAFNTHAGGVDALPMAPLDSSFQRAKEELHDYMDSLDRTGSHAGLAALTYLGQHKDKKMILNLEEMDLRSLAETEVSRSLKWAIPTAVAGIGVFALVGGFVLSPSTWTETATSGEKSETIMPKMTDNSQSQNQPNRRRPASYQPMQQQRSGLTHAPAMNQNDYPTHVETHYNEPDMNHDMDSNAQPEQQENSLVSNQMPPDNNGETLDQVMGSEEAPIPEQPVIEEASDF